MKTQVADQRLCRIARTHRDWLLAESEAWTQKLFRFLAYVNQSDWRAKWILKMVESMRNDATVANLIVQAESDFHKRNRAALAMDKLLINDSELDAILKMRQVFPCHASVIDAADNWVIEVLKDAARAPSDHEWNRLRSSPLNGEIGMSFALQWRYNFGALFGAKASHLRTPGRK